MSTSEYRRTSSSAERRPGHTVAPGGVSHGRRLGWPSVGRRSMASMSSIVSRHIRPMRR